MPPSPVMERLRNWGVEMVGGPLAPFLRRRSLTLPVVALAGLVAGVFEGFGVAMLIPLLGLVMSNKLPAGMPAPLERLVDMMASLDQTQQVLALALVMMLFIILKGLTQGANESYIFRLYSRLASDLRQAIADRLLALDYEFFLRTERTRLIHVMSTESWNAAQSFRQALKIVPATMMLFVFGVVLINISLRLALIGLAAAALVQIFLMILEWRQRKFSEEITRSNRALSERMLAVVAGMRTIRVFGQQRLEADKFAAASDTVRRSQNRVHAVSAAAVPLVEVFASLIFIIIMLAAILTGVPLPTSIAFLVLLARAQPLAQTISKARVEIASLSGAIREVQWVLSHQPRPAPVATACDLPSICAPIRFERVSFAYPDGFAALDEASFTLQPGVVTALIGRSGAGKSTLVSLLCRLVEPTAGRILLGDDDAAAFAADRWRAHIAIAGQDIDLLDGTIADNIAYGKSGATRDEIEDAARTAGAIDFIAAMERGFETRVGLEAVSLSGGQRQRIGLARALVRKPDLLILDEATNAVDAMSENEIIRLLREHRLFHTALIISHRKSTLASCEFGVVLDEGRVSQAGPLEDLDYFRDTMG